MINILNYRVRLPRNLFPYRGKEVLKIRAVSALDPTDPSWTPIGSLGFFQPMFSKTNPFNIPGPFYGAETDTCETGPQEAPRNVLLDPSGQEFLFKQPTNAAELRDIVSAALCECFCGYGADGDDNWTLSLIRDWWRTRFDLLASITALRGDAESVRWWRRLLSSEAEDYLRVYAFFVQERRFPNDRDALPDV